MKLSKVTIEVMALKIVKIFSQENEK